MPPVRFFCKRCSLMMKIGAQMAGRVVVCPQCGARLEVPFQSDPQAEALYQFMKKKRAEEKAAQIVGSLAPTAETSTPPRKVEKPVLKTATKPVETPKPTAPSAPVRPAPPQERHDESFEELEPDEVDRWIDEFWATVPETDADFNRENVPHTLRHAPADGPDVETVSVRYRQTVMLFRIWLAIVFLVGMVLGVYFHSLYADFRQRRSVEARTAEAEADDRERIVQGNLFYRGLDGRPVPDADAVVILLPLDRSPPAVPMTIDGLRPNDELLDAHGDGVQQITEFGGCFLRTGADGSFSVPLKTAGRHLVLLISSHVRRDDEPETVAVKELGRFFRTPRDLPGDYAFALEEYDFEEGKYLLRKTF